MTGAERREALEGVAAEVRDCTRCRLHEGRRTAVPGEGHASTEVMFVGEGPGLNEDREGRPFVGAAGTFLGELLASVGWRRDEVFITNVVKCRPPQNRDPEPDEIAACAPFLRRQAEILDPALVVTLGRHSMGRFMPGARIGQVHGTTAPAPSETGAAEALVFAMYHPAAALHQASLRQTLLDDMAGVPSALLEARRRREEHAAVPAVAEGEDAPRASEVASTGALPAEAVAVEPESPAVPERAAGIPLETASVSVPLDPVEARPLAFEPVALEVGASFELQPATVPIEPAAVVPLEPAGATLEPDLAVPLEPELAVPPEPNPAPDPADLVPAGVPPEPPPAVLAGLEAPGSTDQMTLF